MSIPIRTIGRYVLSRLLDFVYPPLCAVCRTRLQTAELAVCTICALELRHYEPSTMVAHERLYSSSVFRDLYALYAYERGTQVQKLIHSLKYRGHTDVAQLIGRTALELYPQWLGAYDLVLAVPVEQSRLMERGYNQALSVAHVIAEGLGIEASDTHIRRHRGSHSQTHLTRQERMDNTIGAFYLPNEEKKHLIGKRVLLVDDVLTTGSTLLGICSHLEQVDVSCVDVFVASVAI
ncbi:MAG: phosphoribosyltransferase family protein [Porphyromonadaceae bacterium]|nr:phosphoribosyltransferase family protein [Porphyromonadaceae bacterium]